MVPQLRIVRLDLQGGPEALERLVVAPLRLERVPHLFEDLPAEHPGFVERAVQDERVVQRVAGFLESAELVERLRLRHPCVVVVRVELNPNYDHAWMAKAQALHHLGRLEEARDALNNTLILNGSFDEAWVFRGKILEEMGNALEAERCYDEALECFRASLEIEPDNAELRYHQAVLLEDLERVDEAIDGYAAAASKAHGADSLLRLSALLLRVGRAADAIVPADDLRARDPSDPRGWLAAGRALLALGRATEAEVSFRKAAELGAPEAHTELARTLQILARADDALAVLAGIVAPSNETLLLQADLHASLGRMDEALADCDAAIRANADGRDLVYRRKGELLLRSHRSKEAMSAFDAALGLNPTDPDIWCDAARAWRSQGQEDRARKMVDQALRLDPTFSRALDLRSASPASG